MNKSLPNLYLITDRHQIKRNTPFLETIEELLQAGVKMIQLREKDLSAAELYPLAKDLRSLTHRYSSLLLINDRIDLALAVGADGVHLGNHSLSIKVTRKILGSEFLIGASTHSATEIELAHQQGADFVTYGPIYFTPSKAAYGNPVGIQSLQNVCTNASIPVYALGGIKGDNATETLAAGAYGLAMISALLSAPSPTRAYQKLSKHIKSAKK
jgi:thiamine-phosphate pyrophosphorylase